MFCRGLTFVADVPGCRLHYHVLGNFLQGDDVDLSLCVARSVMHHSAGRVPMIASPASVSSQKMRNLGPDGNKLEFDHDKASAHLR